PALTVPDTRGAQAAAPLRGVGMAALRVPVADVPAAAAARRETGGARRVPVLDAHAGVSGAVLQSAGRTHLHVLVARRQAVHPTLGRPVVQAEVLAAHRATVRAGLAAAVLVPADHQHGGRAATMWTGERPAGHAADRALRGERRAASLSGFEPPFGALHQHGGLDELQRMYHRLHLTAPDLLGAATLGRRRDRRDPLRVGLLLEDRLEVSVQPAQLGGERLLRRRAPRRDTLPRLLPPLAQP